MAIYKTLGGDRLGSGNKMKTRLHNYERSNHNLSRKITTSMNVGTLIPTYCNVGLPGDTFKIKIDSLIKTIPTVAPLFGSFKFQTDFFVAPFRLYQGILHNNPLNIGMNMKDVLLPKIYLTQSSGNNKSMTPFSYSCLLKYLGISGMPTGGNYQTQAARTSIRKFNAIPILAYYDIFKNYYANKQEENAYYIGNKTNYTINAKIKYLSYGENGNNWTEENVSEDESYWSTNEITIEPYSMGDKISQIRIETTNYNWKEFYITINSTEYRISDLMENKVNSFGTDGKNTLIVLNSIESQFNIEEWEEVEISITLPWQQNNNLAINNFPLENIDTMRYKLLSNNTIGDEYIINNNEIKPYCDLTKNTDANTTYNNYELNGICLKTYQSDIFNNWLNTEWIDGENGINAITTIDVSEGLTMDALNLGQKIYNLMNRIAIAGGTYQDYIEAAWGEEVVKRCETPIYIGGISTEIVFQEVVSTAETEVNGEVKPQGTLAGKGIQLGKKGGYLEFKINGDRSEPVIIMAISSITPRISYYQGNDWYMTELNSIDDLHKPELDGIGFQDLITEQMAYWDCQNTSNGIFERNSAGKQPAWLNYMTDYDRVFGDFCDNNKAGFMVLKRDYENIVDSRNVPSSGTTIGDLTTYIDPTKYNYAFADQRLEAQNFWVQLYFDIKARRKMSARIIPNL